MRFVSKAALAVGITGTAISVAVAGLAGSALADPPAGVTPRVNDIVGVGSDTTQNVFNQISTDYNAQNPAPANKLYSFDAFGTPASIATKAGCAAVTRPSGSGAGIAELKKNLRPTGNTTSYCVDFARSSRGPAAGGADAGLSFVRFAQDAVTWSATSSTSAPTNAPSSLSITQLRAIYSCNAGLVGGTANAPVRWNQVGGTGTNAVVPVLPQASSGTRSFFLSAIGVSTVGSCVQQPAGLEENQGQTAPFTGAQSRDLVFPYSVAVYLAQSQNGKGTGKQGNQVLRSVTNSSGTAVAPTVGSAGKLTLNPQLSTVGLTRFVYNALRGTSVPAYLQPIFGNGNNTGYLCTNATAQKDITNFGFRTIGTQCGAITAG